MRCEQCGDLIPEKMGRVPKFCSGACRQKAYRARKASVPYRKLVERTEGRWVRSVGKRPVMVGGSPASSTDSSTWTSFTHVCSGVGDGFGVMLGGGVGAYDLDGCIEDGVLASWGREVIELIPEPVLFMEVSQSGRGVHVFVEAAEGRGSRRGGVERYTRARFIKTTLREFKL